MTLIIGDLEVDLKPMARLFPMLANPDMTMPFPVLVLFTHTSDELEKVVGKQNIGAHSFTTHDGVDENGYGAYIFMSLEHAYLSVLTHEITHIALFHHARTAKRKPANRYLQDHPESLAEMIGNMTAAYWYRITEGGIELT